MEVKYVENPKVNEKVVEIIGELKEEIVSRFHPKSVILSGSFGRGEATVVEINGKLKFLSDCEVILVPNWYIFRRDDIKEFYKHFRKKTGLKVDISGTFLSFQLMIPILRKFKPTINNYDLKYGSKTIYGKDYLKMIPDFKPGDIPIWEGIRLLFNRMVEALEHFSIDDPTEEMVFWIDKIILACQDALLLSQGKYHPSYRERNKVFSKLFSTQFNLKINGSRFLELTREATERKLNGCPIVEQPLEYWFETMNICDKVFRYIIKKDMQIEFSDYLEFQEKYLSHYKLREYTRLPFGNPMGQNFWSLMKQLIVYKKLPSLKLIRKFTTYWAHIVYSTIPLIYFGLSRQMKINERYLTQVMNTLLLFGEKNLSYNDPLEGWKYARKQVLKYWRQMCW